MPEGTSVRIVVDSVDTALSKRASRYVAFNSTFGVLVNDIDQAAVVTLYPNGTIAYENLHVVGLELGNQTILGLSDIAPVLYALWNADDSGNVLLEGSSGFCIDGSPNVIVKTNNTVPTVTCQTVRLSFLPEDDTAPSTTTSSSLSTISSMTNSSTTVTTMSFTDMANTTTTPIFSNTTTTIASFTGITNTTTTPTFSNTTTTITSSACPATDTAMIAVTNGNVNQSAYANLFLSNSAVLNYAAAPPGQNAVSVTIQSSKQLIVFENTKYFEPISCSDNAISVVATDGFAYSLATLWPQNDFVIITNSPGCNSATERGTYLVESHTSDDSTSTITFVVSKVKWDDFAETMTLGYGTVASSNSTDAVYSSSCTNTLAAPTTSTSPANSTSTSLSPAAKAMLDYIMKQVVYDPDKNEMLIVSKPDIVEIEGGNKVAADDEVQKILDMLKQDGIPDPDALFTDAQPPEDGDQSNPEDTTGTCKITPGVLRICEILPTCPTSNSPASLTRKKQKRNSTMSLDAAALMLRAFDPVLEQRHLDGRDEKFDEFMEYVCSDWAEIILAPFEKINEIRELACAIKELYDARHQLWELLKCMTNPFCFNPPTVTITITFPPATRWKYTYGWKASWNGLNGYYIVMGTPGNYIQCKDCSFSISDLTIDGALTFNVSAQTVTEARNTVRMSSVARLIMGLETTGPWTGKGTAFQSTLSLGEQQVDSMFSFTPTIVFSLGAEANSNAPVSSIGGAVLTFNGATVDLDYLTRSASGANNWQPSVVMTNPGFKNDAKVNFAPIMITDTRIQMNVLKGVLKSYSAITSKLSIGFNATYSETAGGSCGAKQLSVKSYVKSSSNAVFDGQAPIPLGGDTANNPVMCYNVPTYFPSGEEVSSLAQVGGDFCTSYIGYKPPVKVVSTGTVTSLLSSTTQTVTTTSTTTDTATSTITETFSSSLAATITITAKNTQSVGGGTDSLGTQNKRSDAMPARRLLERAPVETPAIVAGWPNDKISYACSIIATGTKTATVFTSTTTTYTETSTGTVTATRFVGVDGPPESVTTTSTRYIITSLASATVNAAAVTAVTTQCPLQTQVACFKVKAHGTDLVEGLYLGTGLANSRGPAVLGANTAQEDSIFYLDSAGRLISASSRKPLSYITTPLKPPVQCNPLNHYPEGQGGCSSNCFCDLRGEGGAVCVDDQNIRGTCLGGSDFECGADTFCDVTIGNQCESWYGCTSTYTGPFVEFPDQFWPGEALIIEPGSGTSGVASTCQIDCDTLRLTCTGPDGLTQLRVFDPQAQIANKNYAFGNPGWPNGFIDLPFRMMWKTGPAGYDTLPIYLTVEEAQCPCRY